MVSPVLNENFHAGAHLVAEVDPLISREQVILLNQGGSEVVFQGGLVLAKLTATGQYVPYDNVGTDGSEAAAAILWRPVTVPAGGTKRVTVTARLTVVNLSELQWDASVDAAGKTAALADLAPAFIIAR
ncbi:head decoration protein [Roseomonas indoligenes]|uniref:Head decoration protein n=1 Tax=Roseomonas indoligenes TaxID=2820811 RepID=A0A940MX97_9PROT|nr:head decoration protein [Pararoseomonas indoligenes]MBP0492872.1 head decoration protein [Pararoseomonas indoligenes]